MNIDGNDEFILTRTRITRMKKAILLGKGSDIKISKTQISHILKKGLGMQNSPFVSPSFVIKFPTGKSIQKDHTTCYCPLSTTTILRKLGESNPWSGYEKNDRVKKRL